MTQHPQMDHIAVAKTSMGGNGKKELAMGASACMDGRFCIAITYYS